MTEIERQARMILDALVQRPFSGCVAITRDFADLTTKPGIYAVRHRTAGLLYVGKAQDVKERFRGGHKAITWSWLEDRQFKSEVHPILMYWQRILQRVCDSQVTF
jgi:GIY-YIG catalytic domain